MGIDGTQVIVITQEHKRKQSKTELQIKQLNWTELKSVARIPWRFPIVQQSLHTVNDNKSEAQK